MLRSAIFAIAAATFLLAPSIARIVDDTTPELSAEQIAKIDEQLALERAADALVERGPFIADPEVLAELDRAQPGEDCDSAGRLAFGCLIQGRVAQTREPPSGKLANPFNLDVNAVYANGSGLKILVFTNYTYDFVELSSVATPNKLVMTFIGADLYLTSSDSGFMPADDPNTVIVVGAADESHMIESIVTGDGNWAFGGFSYSRTSDDNDLLEYSDAFFNSYSDANVLSVNALVSDSETATNFGMAVQLSMIAEQEALCVI